MRRFRRAWRRSSSAQIPVRRGAAGAFLARRGHGARTRGYARHRRRGFVVEKRLAVGIEQVRYGIGFTLRGLVFVVGGTILVQVVCTSRRAVDEQWSASWARASCVASPSLRRTSQNRARWRLLARLPNLVCSSRSRIPYGSICEGLGRDAPRHNFINSALGMLLRMASAG